MTLTDWNGLNSREARTVYQHKARELNALGEARQLLQKRCPSSDALVILAAEQEIIKKELNQLNSIIHSYDAKEDANNHSVRA